MERTIVSNISSREFFIHLLNNNTGLIILKFGAEWCGPCAKIKTLVNSHFIKQNEHVICGDIDIDESFDVYAYLKSKKMVSGIPCILCYKKGNTTFIPDDSVSGTNENEINDFFTRCDNHFQDVRIRLPEKKFYETK
jgi:thioredoxin-like negative regulator of GroEL